MANATQVLDGAIDHFELVLRVQPARTGDPLHALVKDILKSRLDVEAETGDGSYVRARGFSDLAKALAASRALQLACEGFRGAAPGERANLAVVLDSPAPEELLTGHASLSVEQKDLLDQAKPSQVLITQALYNRIAQYQPLALRSFPPRAGVYEFLWTSVQRLEELRVEGQWMPALVAEPKPLEDLQNTVISYPALRIPETPAQEPVPATAPQRSEIAEDDEPAPGRSLTRIIGIGVAAVVIIAVACLAIWRYTVGNSQPMALTQPTPTNANPPNPQPPPTVPPSSPPEQHYPTQAPSKPTVKGGKTRPAESSPDQNAAATSANPGSRSAKCSIEPSNISIALRVAQNSRNSGRFADAERQFRAVLDCEPNNPEARQGLLRIKEDEKLR